MAFTTPAVEKRPLVPGITVVPFGARPNITVAMDLIRFRRLAIIAVAVTDGFFGVGAGAAGSGAVGASGAVLGAAGSRRPSESNL